MRCKESDRSCRDIKGGKKMNKVALITGATRGIGKQIALKLAQNGYDIALNYRTQNEELENIKEEIESNNVKCLTVQGDVSSFEDCERFVKEIIEEYGKIDVLINNAGICNKNKTGKSLS